MKTSAEINKRITDHFNLWIEAAKIKGFGIYVGELTLEISNDIRSRVAGRAKLSSGVVYINSSYALDENGEWSKHLFLDTIPHEIAHHIVFRRHPRAKQYHGPEFRHVASILGFGGETYHRMKRANEPERVTRAKKRLVCGSCNMMWRANKQVSENLARGYSYTCKCGAKMLSSMIKMVK